MLGGSFKHGKRLAGSFACEAPAFLMGLAGAFMPGRTPLEQVEHAGRSAWKCAIISP